MSHAVETLHKLTETMKLKLAQMEQKLQRRISEETLNGDSSRDRMLVVLENLNAGQQ
jgi:hypothetical protein